MKTALWLDSKAVAQPVSVPYAQLTNPQTLNLYHYVQNNPETNVDPDGHCVADGVKHNFFWCAFHWSGWIQTDAEKKAEQDAYMR